VATVLEPRRTRSMIGTRAFRLTNTVTTRWPATRFAFTELIRGAGLATVTRAVADTTPAVAVTVPAPLAFGAVRSPVCVIDPIVVDHDG
jgi:hypothetical protein